MDRLETGITELDRDLQGGVPPGSLIVIRTDPASQGELLLKQLTHQRPTLYLSTLRTEPDVREWLDDTAGRNDNTPPKRVEYMAMDTPIETVKDNIGMESRQKNIIIDPINPLEKEDYTKYVTMLQSIKTHLANTGSIAVLHVLKDGDESENRSRTLALADMVWDVTHERNGEDLDTRLKITKCRSGVLPDKISKVDLGERVRIDTSRDIA